MFNEVATGEARIVRDFAYGEIRHWEGGQQFGRFKLGFGQDEPIEIALKLVNQHHYTWKALQPVAQFCDPDALERGRQYIKLFPWEVNRRDETGMDVNVSLSSEAEHGGPAIDRACLA